MNDNVALRYNLKHSQFIRQKAFSLVEIVLAVGLFAFVAVALMGLFSVGLRVNRESVDEIEAAHLAESLLATRRAAPLAALGGDFPLPPLNTPGSVPASTPLFITSAGKPAPSAGEARFGLVYRIVPPGGAEPFARVYLCLFWPPQDNPGKARGRWEISGAFRL